MVSPVADALPRFSGPAQVRQRMRLVAALGILAIAALATGGLASLTAKRSDRADASKPTGASTLPNTLPGLLDPAHLVQDRVEQAERAQTRARAALRSARQLGLVDPAQLDQLERQLETSAASISSGSSGTPNPEGASEAGASNEALASSPLDARPRSL